VVVAIESAGESVPEARPAGPDLTAARADPADPAGADKAARSVRPARPPRLRPGDKVAVVAPSGPVEPERLEAGCATLRGLGLEVVVGAHVLDRAGYLAGGDAQRAADLQRAWCDPGVRAVLCARGGYGAIRLLELLDWPALRAAGPKILYGSSDITALHCAFGRRLAIATVFGPMVAGALADPRPAELDHARAALFDVPAPLRGRVARGGAYADPPARGGRGGRPRGPLAGGNLALLAALAGTPYAPEPAAGRIAFLEDVDEAPYRIDRMLTQLLLAGWFDGVAGIVLGSWVSCGPSAQVEAVLADRLGPLGVPVLAGVPVGHGRPQLTVELGGMAELDPEDGRLIPLAPRIGT
jgi:muramoyltetrapeptide carboxypeptidase